MTLTVGSLFSGIGGLDLGLERAGMTIRWQCEVDEFCARVLDEHWPDVPNLGDVKTIDWGTVERVDVLCGGYPCQPFSLAGLRRGATDARHLWPHFRDAIRTLRPRYVVLENVPGHLSLGFDAVLADLASLGLDAEWEVIRACAFGASHTRARLFVVAYSSGSDEPGPLSRHPRETTRDYGRPESRGSGCGESRPGRWLPEPTVDRMADGVPRGVVRPELEALGNAVVPQVAEWIGRRLMGVAA